MPRPRIALAAATASVAAAAFAVLGPVPGALADDGPAVAFTIGDPRITESSGLAASHLHKGVYWTHNDSGDGPYIYAVDSATGKTVATVTMRGIDARDVEAISLGPDGDIYVGDIGDNLGGTWPHVWIYRFAEPKQLRDTTADVVRYTVQYQGGPRNAEALMVHPKTGRVYIASKNQDGGNLYAGPKTLSTHGVNIFRPIAEVPWVTDGSFSPDGTRLVLRGYFWATGWRWSGDAPQKIGSLDVPMQRQGESVAFTPDGRALMYGTEGKDSDVWRAPLSGAELPDSVAAEPTGSATTGRSGGQGSASSAGADAAKGGSSGHSATVLGFAVLAAIFAAATGLRRILRRRRD
ncbi:hypothetical protein QMK19_33650 [Streptomyces sp. H10-C2]|uniref:hypothetical protein n=1 Tax=unclassified Streptomyces TaxID=2593676 RepID=UPI0024BA4692|nr:MULTISPECIES: hypothetical protein [unclassified Streptomyces]MDJ0345205.1 hypothetical protein [Streptomyces sp. PH10-H1]MDJ0374438.1 hypothetical protein [Streptomyces sp. H10-C2]